MGFGKEQTVARISSDRLAAVAGVPISAPPVDTIKPVQQYKPVSLEPDLSRIRKNRIEETPEERKKRLAAKTVNFGASFLARIAIISAVGWFGYEAYWTTGDIPQGIALGACVLVADFGRVLVKAMEPGTK